MKSHQLEFALLQKIQEIDDSRPYQVFVSSGWGQVQFNLGEEGLRGMHLVEATENEILEWVKQNK